MLHCHLDFHVETGMAVILKVGNVEDLPAIPENFPRCGNYYHQKNSSQPVTNEYVSFNNMSKWKDHDRYIYLIAEEPRIPEKSVLEKFFSTLKSSFNINTAVSVMQLQKKLYLLVFIIFLWR